ncbi:hypothetical protein D3C78_1852530 [compost metagenome]
MAAQEPMMPISPSLLAGVLPALLLVPSGALLRAFWWSLRMRATACSISSWSKGLAM